MVASTECSCQLLLLLMMISSFHTIRTGQLCRNSIVDEFYSQDIKLMLYRCEGPYDRSIFSSLYLGRLGIGFLWVWDESRPLVKCNGSDHWRTSFTKSCSRNVSTAILYCTRSGTRSQCSVVNASVMWSCGRRCRRVEHRLQSAHQAGWKLLAIIYVANMSLIITCH